MGYGETRETPFFGPERPQSESSPKFFQKFVVVNRMGYRNSPAAVGSYTIVQAPRIWGALKS